MRWCFSILTNRASRNQRLSLGAGVVVPRLLCAVLVLCPAPPLRWIHLLLRGPSFLTLVFIQKHTSESFHVLLHFLISQLITSGVKKKTANYLLDERAHTRLQDPMKAGALSRYAMSESNIAVTYNSFVLSSPLLWSIQIYFLHLNLMYMYMFFISSGPVPHGENIVYVSWNTKYKCYTAGTVRCA